MSKKKISTSDLDQQSLVMHAAGRPGKIEITPSKPLETQHDLALAYSPGVAAPCRVIADNPDDSYTYTSRGNLVAVISNGTAILGLGNLGAAASKPVMEGKAVLFKRFADIDSIDLEVDTTDVDAFIECVRHLEPSFGAINLEDIKAPDCFVIEQRLQESMGIPVFHDDQHGTAVIVASGMINALELTGRKPSCTRVVMNGAGASALACAGLLKKMGFEDITLCDRTGVIYESRKQGMNPYKQAFARKTKMRSLADALAGADAFIGLSSKDVLDEAMVRSMNRDPIIFALANPDPEILPERARAIRPDCIIATGRSDYPNQINNVLGFPFIFRGALDVRARCINDEMKIAAARSLAALAREDVPDEVDRAYGGKHLTFGREYLIPVPFDPRLISTVPPAVAQAAQDSGVAGLTLPDGESYRRKLRARLDPTFSILQTSFAGLKARPGHVVFAEGEQKRSLRAGISFVSQGFGQATLIGQERIIKKNLQSLGIDALPPGLKIENAALTKNRERYLEYLYKRLHRRGYLQRDCQRMVNQNRNIFAACMVALGYADAMVTGLTRNYRDSYRDIRKAIDPSALYAPFGLTVATSPAGTLFVADTTITEEPSPEQLAYIAIKGARYANWLGHTPRVAFISSASFTGARIDSAAKPAVRISGALEILRAKKVDFLYDGEMTIDAALDPELAGTLYPFNTLKGVANVLIMPTMHAANISAKLLYRVGHVSVIGPMLLGMEATANIVTMSSSTSSLVTAAAMAVRYAQDFDKPKNAPTKTKKSGAQDLL
ncbi:MAG: NADP-dependent malic enzyme [Pseudomonadota bacterium]